MKKLLFGLVATIMLSVTGNAQETAKALGCSADCFFNDCIVRCPPGTIPKCKCILGSFSSCSCAEMIGKIVDPKNNPKLTLKNKKNIQEVIDFLKENKLDQFVILFNEMFKNIEENNFEAYNKNFNLLEQISIKEVENSKKIEDFVKNLK
jgi:hypothetical protein